MKTNEIILSDVKQSPNEVIFAFKKSLLVAGWKVDYWEEEEDSKKQETHLEWSYCPGKKEKARVLITSGNGKQ